MNKLVKYKWWLIGIGVLVLLGLFSNKAEAAVDFEIGQFEKRIDSGAYTGSEGSTYYKGAGEIPVFSSLGLVGEVEYVDSDNTEIYATVATVLDTPVGDVGAGAKLSQVDGEEDLYEVFASYDVSILGFGATVDVSYDENEEGIAELSASQLLAQINDLSVYVGGGYGQSFGATDNYTYTLGFARAQLDALYVQVNYLKNDLSGYAGTDNAWADTVDVGLALQF
tara:strand:+ start:205 stop:876 length:672 start_codon:yes stop_codon:yes gene_type:complete